MLPPFVYGLAAKAAFRAAIALEDGAKAATPWIKKQFAKALVSAVPGPGAPGRQAPERVITLVGRASAGKSSLGNALLGHAVFAVGTEHGTTSMVHAVPFRAGYRLQDTPGLLDGEKYSSEVLNAARASSLVVLVTTGQLYRQELDFLRLLCASQRNWNSERGTRSARSTVVFVNAGDLKKRTMPSGVRAEELSALREQIQDWVPGDHVLAGAAAPCDGKAPRIDSLKALLEKFLSHAAA